jgi:uncharacterized coiled-coil protein SlyX
MNNPPLGSAAIIPPAAVPTLEDLMRLLQESQARFQQLETRMQQQDVVIGQQDVRLQQQQVEMNQTKVELNQAQGELLNLQNVNAVPAAAIPVVQELPELAAGTVLENRKKVVVVVSDDMIIRAFTGTLTDIEKANLKPPVIKSEDVNTMKPSDYMSFARSMVHYYNVGGEKPISAILDEGLVGTLAGQFGMSVTALANLSRQLLIYEFLKVWWEKPDDDATSLIEDIKKIELLPAVKGSVEMVVNAFVKDMKRIVVCAYTKSMLDVIKNRVFIENWKSEYMTQSYSSYQDFYDHLLSLAKKYDTSNNQTVELRSSKSTPRQDKQKKGKGGGGNNTPLEEKKDEGKPDKPKKACQLCGKEDHWAFALTNDYSKAYGDHVNWTCPEVSTKSKEVKQQVWDARVSQHNKRYAKWAARKAAPKK